jgi:hypothetical protein
MFAWTLFGHFVHSRFWKAHKGLVTDSCTFVCFYCPVWHHGSQRPAYATPLRRAARVAGHNDFTRRESRLGGDSRSGSSFGGELGPVTSERVANAMAGSQFQAPGTNANDLNLISHRAYGKAGASKLLFKCAILCLHEDYSFSYDPI